MVCQVPTQASSLAAVALTSQEPSHSTVHPFVHVNGSCMLHISTIKHNLVHLHGKFYCYSNLPCWYAGAEQITLEGVYHSPLGSVAAPEGGDMPGKAAGRVWYGSPQILEAWLPHILDDNLQSFQVEVGDMVSTDASVA